MRELCMSLPSASTPSIVVLRSLHGYKCKFNKYHKVPYVYWNRASLLCAVCWVRGVLMFVAAMDMNLMPIGGTLHLCILSEEVLKGLVRFLSLLQEKSNWIFTNSFSFWVHLMPCVSSRWGIHVRLGLLSSLISPTLPVGQFFLRVRIPKANGHYVERNQHSIAFPKFTKLLLLKVLCVPSQVVELP